jgi:uncharacterized protein
MSMFGMFFPMFDPLMLLFMLPGLLLGMYAQFKLSGTYNHFSQVPTTTGITGAEAAREILDSAGLSAMPIEMVHGHLTDHYDPMRKALFLSEENYYGRSLAAVGVAAHEAGHALQHKAAYFPLHMRMAMVPITNIATQAALFMSLIGFAIGAMGWITAGVITYGIMFAFNMITLPVEFDASSRAKAQLEQRGLVHAGAEATGVSKVLNAAAMTYVAAMITSALQFAYFAFRLMNMRNSERD